MKRIDAFPRDAWKQTVEKQGLLFHSNADETPYWDETAYFVFSESEIHKLEQAANELHGMFLKACEVAIIERRLAEFGIPETLHEAIRKSWRYDDWELYGRFDFTITPDGIPKLLEYNADTPTGLVEASLIQWYWKEELHPQSDQFNSLHDALVSRWKNLIKKRSSAYTAPASPDFRRGAYGRSNDCGVYRRNRGTSGLNDPILIGQ